jgi:hypothetical protein
MHNGLTTTKLLKKHMVAALKKSMGIVTPAAEAAGINRCTHYKWMNDDPKYKTCVEEIADIALDFAETKLMKSINDGSDTMIIFYLKTKGKKRGYIERNETEHTVKFGKHLEDETYI